MSAATTTVEKLADRMGLTNLTPDIDLSERIISFYDVNRPALQLTGFFEHFDVTRVQIVGNVEQQYIDSYLVDKMTAERFEKIAAFNVPCVIFSR